MKGWFRLVVVLDRGWRLVPAASFHLSFENPVSAAVEISGLHVSCRNDGIGSLPRLVSCLVALRFLVVHAHDDLALLGGVHAGIENIEQRLAPVLALAFGSSNLLRFAEKPNGSSVVFGASVAGAKGISRSRLTDRELGRDRIPGRPWPVAAGGARPVRRLSPFLRRKGMSRCRRVAAFAGGVASVRPTHEVPDAASTVQGLKSVPATEQG